MSKRTGTETTSVTRDMPGFSQNGGAVGIQFDFSADYTGSGVTLKGRVKDSGMAWLLFPYIRYNVAGAASDMTPVSTAIAADGAIQIPVADGFDLQLDFNVTAGSVSWAVFGASVR